MAFNNAGIQAPPSDAADETVENFDQVNAVNLTGVWAAQRHELRHMRAQGTGAIVNNSSLGGLIGLPERAAYHASKHGVIGLTNSAAVEYAPRGSSINAICPGVIETPMSPDILEGQAEAMAGIMQDQPIGRRLGTADEIAAAVCGCAAPPPASSSALPSPSTAASPPTEHLRKEPGSHGFPVRRLFK